MQVAANKEYECRHQLGYCFSTNVCLMYLNCVSYCHIC
jgi:hypothetical protein